MFIIIILIILLNLINDGYTYYFHEKIDNLHVDSNGTVIIDCSGINPSYFDIEVGSEYYIIKN